MKYTLLLDSSNSLLVVGLAKDEEVIDKVIYEAWQRQSECMIVEINNLLQKHNVNKEDINGVVVSIGPGSYTGVRISLTIAKIIALSLNVSIYPVSSLEILKDGLNPSICLMNARSGRSYVGVYNGEKTLQNDTIFKNEEVLSYIKEHPDFSLCGDCKYLGIESKDVDIVLNMLILKKFTKKITNPHLIKPIYLKD